MARLPFGWHSVPGYDPVTGHRARAPHAGEQAALALMRALRAAGRDYAAIARALAAAGHRSKADGAITDKMVKRALRGPA